MSWFKVSNFQASKKETREIFDLFDKDKSGFIDAKELAQVLKSLKMNVSKEDVAEMIDEVINY